MSKWFVLARAVWVVLVCVSLSLVATVLLTSWVPASSDCPNLKAVEGAYGPWGSCSGFYRKTCSRVKYPDTCVTGTGTNCVASTPDDPQGQRKRCVYDQNLQQWVCPPNGAVEPYGSQTHYTTVSCPYSPGP